LADFLSRACHDLRAPVRAIRAHTELFLRNPAPAADSASRLAFILDGAKKLDALVEALSAYSVALRINTASFRPMAMDVLLRTSLAKLREPITSTGAEVTHSELPRVSGDPDRLVELLERLIRNALEHRTPAPPRIHITAKKRARGWLFAVADNGSGIEAAYLERIFNPLEQILGSSSSSAGMGLAICRVIVERHRGRIWAESQAGLGATIFFTLPAGKAPAEPR
jgi:light-regulated signal transduction histidine kinase (bacteriophytochrome)